jgi:hypothetical protein
MPLRPPRPVDRGEVRYLGEFDNTPDAVAKLVRKLGDRYETPRFCYEAGPSGAVCIESPWGMAARWSRRR